MQEMTRKKFLEFEEARAIVRRAELKNHKQWEQWCRDGHRPSDIPSHPDQTYSDKGWLSWRDWLGHGEGLPPVGTFLEFEEARALVRKAELKNKEQWEQWCRVGHRPYDIPSLPNQTYKDKGWLSWPDWLGYGVGRPKCRSMQEMTRKKFLEFEEARAIVRRAELKKVKEWQQWCRDGHRPSNIPSNPDVTYSDKGWLSWRDWLGYGEGLPPVGTFLVFEEARAIVRKAELKSCEQWEEWCRDGHRPSNIASHPALTYKDKGWVSMADWLGYATASSTDST